MFTDKDAEKLMFESREALCKIKSAKAKKKETLTELKEDRIRFDRGKHFFEPYDTIAYEGKVKVDMMYYNQFLQKIEEDISPKVQEIITSLYQTINAIYEFINVKPEIYGNGIDLTILDTSMEDSKRKLSRVVYDFLDRNFYKLNSEQRKNKYFEEHKEYAKSLIADGATPDDAIMFSVKSLVTENLLTSISFPFGVWSRINYLIEDEDYEKIFDKDKLVDLVETFQRKIRNVARIVASCI